MLSVYRNRSMEFYSTSAWRKLRGAYRRAHPLCARCHAKAEHIDHVIDIRTAPHLRLDWWNLQALCQACHNEKTAADEAGRSIRPHGGCDADGMPIDPRHPWAEGKAQSNQWLGLRDQARCGAMQPSGAGPGGRVATRGAPRPAAGRNLPLKSGKPNRGLRG